MAPESSPQGDQPEAASKQLPGAEIFAAAMKSAAEGADEALREIVLSCQSYLLLVANQEIGTDMQAKYGASDIVQSALFQAQRNLGQFRGQSREELLGWLRQIVINQIYGAHRRMTTKKRDIHRELNALDSEQHHVAEVADDLPSPRSEAILGEQAERLRGVLRKLPPDYRAVVLLRNWEQLSFPEIGERMKRSGDAVKKIWSRAMRIIQKELSDESRGI